MVQPILGQNFLDQYSSSRSSNSTSSSSANDDNDHFKMQQSSNGYTSTNSSIFSEEPMDDTTAVARLQAISSRLDSESTNETDNNISSEDLRLALADKTGEYSDKDKAAIQYLYDNRNGLRSRLDANDGNADTLITVDTLNREVADPGSTSEKPIDDSTAVARIQAISSKLDNQNVGGDTDGRIHLDDLNSALADNTGKYSEEDKTAIRYLIDNQNGLRGRLDGFDGNGDSMIQVDTLNEVVADPKAKPGDDNMSNSAAILTLKDYLLGKGQERLTREDLLRLQDDTTVSADVRTAAKKFLDDPDLFSAADDGHLKDGTKDGTIGHNDLKQLLNRSDVDKIGKGASADTSSDGGDEPVIQDTAGSQSDDYFKSYNAGSSDPSKKTGDSNLDFFNWMNYTFISPSVEDYNRHVKK